MELNNPIFIFVFFPIFLLFYSILKNEKHRLISVLLFSLFVYAFDGKKSVLLLLFIIIISYIVAKLCQIIESQRIQNIVLGFFLSLSVLILSLFKNYLSLVFISPVVPIGLSYYIFKAISFVLDVKDNKEMHISLVNTGLYISLFTEISSGPITLYRDFDYAINNRADSSDSTKPYILIAHGLFKKVVIGTTLSIMYSKVVGLSSQDVGTVLYMARILIFSLQLYFDFSGYTTLALGISGLFGFDFKDNFEYPYLAKSISDFWKRWHISLTTWFRNYVYFPLGGNRVSKTRVIFNIMVVFILSGIWHGPSTNFLLWGIYNGIFMILERNMYGKRLNQIWLPLQYVYSILIIFIGWTIFSTNSVTELIQVLRSFVIFKESNYYIREVFSNKQIFTFIFAIVFVIFEKLIISNVNKIRGWKLSLIISFIIIISMVELLTSGYSPSIYTKF